MNKLVQEIIKPILEANSKIKKVVGIYGGRFQPFGPHHYKTYKWLEKQVDIAFITTSNIKKPPRHPMNFKEKVRHMSKMGVKSNRIVEEKTPYVANNVLKKFDPKTTAVVYIFGQKDAGRLQGGTKKGGGKTYYQDFKKNKNNLEGYETHGYILTAPHVSIKVGGKEVSGTVMRELLGSPKIDDKIRPKLFKKAFGYYDKGVYNMMTNKFKKLFEHDVIIPWDNTKPKPKKKWWFDGKKRDILHDIEETIGHGYPNEEDMKKIKKRVNKARSKSDTNKEFQFHPVSEIELPIKVGDTIMMGRFKNKKVVVKTIEFNDKGDLLINGKSAMRFRILKSEEIEKFIINNDITKILREYSSTTAQGLAVVDDGPNAMMGGMSGYASRNKVWAEKLGWEVIDYILNVNPDELPPTGEEILDTGWPMGPHNSVSYLPAGIGTGATPNNQENLTGTKGYDKWIRAMKSKAEEVGMQLMKFTRQDRITRAQIARDTVDTLNTQKEEEVTESFSKDWWKHILNEKVDTNKLISVAKTLCKKYGVNPKIVLKSSLGKGDYAHFDFDNKIMLISKKATRDLKEFLISVLHEIDHAKDLKKMGRRFIDDYEYYSNMIAQGNLPGKKDPYWDNPYEIKAEKFGRKEAKKYNIKKLFGESLQENIVTKTQLKPREKELLLMGGAYGHMAHPFDDKDLTFGDLKKIITLGLGGQLNREDNVTEKLDGQNIMVSFKDGKLIAARNKGHLKNGGKTALDKKGIASKFKGRGSIRNAFVYAMNDLEKAIKSLSDKQQEKIFNNGYNFMNLEVMYPSSANVIDYDVTQLIFHGALKYDDKGNVIGEVPGSGRMLQGMIKQRNQNIQKKYSIGKPVFLDVPKHQDFGKLKSKFLSTLTRYQKKFNLKDNDTLGLYHQKWWEQFITKKSKGKITGNTLKGLVKRWAFFDKSYKIPEIKKDLEGHPEFLDWVLKYDKEDHAKQVKENMRPFEVLFFEVGAEILKNVKGFISANPKKSVRNMVKNLDKAIKVVKSGGDVKKLSRLRTQLDRLNAIGGTKAIVPSEGLVFKYKGKTYKFTGAFAPVNQITGLIYF